MRACDTRQLLIHSHEMELTSLRVVLKLYSKQYYKAAAAGRRMCEVEGDGVVSERVAHRWFQRFNTREENATDFPCSGRPKMG